MKHYSFDLGHLKGEMVDRVTSRNSRLPYPPYTSSFPKRRTKVTRVEPTENVTHVEEVRYQDVVGRQVSRVVEGGHGELIEVGGYSVETYFSKRPWGNPSKHHSRLRTVERHPSMGIVGVSRLKVVQGSRVVKYLKKC